MVVDTAAYRLLHRAGTGAPCLSLDIIKDDLGDDRESLPLSLLLCAGTQANTAQGNRLMVLKMLNLHGPRRGAGSGADSDSEDEDDEEEDEERSPRLHLAMIPHYGTINRVRVADLPPGPIAAVWSERGSVELYELGPALGVLEEEGGDGTPNLRQLKEQKPTFSFGGHQDEGYAMDWSPTVPGRLLSGDNGGRIHQWEPREGGTWDVKPRPFRGHTAAVEDVQWAPREAPVFVSCSCDSSVRIWDIRAPPGGGAMLSVDHAHPGDVNVISWGGAGRGAGHHVISGGDDGAVRVWDLRVFETGRSAATLKFHSGPITSLQWCPTEKGVLAACGADDALTQWDLGLERDPEADIGDMGGDDELPPQLLFVHMGDPDPKELRWHPQCPGVMLCTGINGISVFRTVCV